MFSQLVRREELQLRAELDERKDLHIGFTALHYPSLFALCFVCAGVDVTLHLNAEQVRALQAQMYARLILAPRIEKDKRRAMAATR